MIDYLCLIVQCHTYIPVYHHLGFIQKISQTIKVACNFTQHFIGLLICVVLSDLNSLRKHCHNIHICLSGKLHNNIKVNGADLVKDTLPSVSGVSTQYLLQA